MSTDPVREIGRIEDDQGRILIVGIDYGTVTLGLGGGGVVMLGPMQTEELAQLIVSATRQAGWRTAQAVAAVADGAS